jgi:secondary thiamine-phosphate synthase enzyme
VHEITIKTDRHTEVVDITARVQEALDQANGAAAALVYVPHTTAGVTINEHADPALKSDIENALEQIVDDDWG